MDEQCKQTEWRALRPTKRRVIVALILGVAFSFLLLVVGIELKRRFNIASQALGELSEKLRDSREQAEWHKVGIFTLAFGTESDPHLHVSCMGKGLGCERLEKLNRLRGVTGLRFSNVDFDECSIKFADGFAAPRLSVHIEHSQLSDNQLQFLTTLPPLGSLILDRTNLKGAGLAFLSADSRLESLQITNGPLSGGLEHIRSEKLTSLDLSNTLVDDDALTKLGRQPNLLYLDLSATRISNTAIKVIQLMPSLKQLDLSNTNVDDIGIADLQVAGLRQLEQFKLDGCSVGDACLENLSGLVSLKRLHLERTQITDDGLKRLETFPLLSNVHLNETRTSLDAVNRLKQHDLPRKHYRVSVDWSPATRQIRLE